MIDVGEKIRGRTVLERHLSPGGKPVYVLDWRDTGYGNFRGYYGDRMLLHEFPAEVVRHFIDHLVREALAEIDQRPNWPDIQIEPDSVLWRDRYGPPLQQLMQDASIDAIRSALNAPCSTLRRMAEHLLPERTFDAAGQGLLFGGVK